MCWRNFFFSKPNTLKDFHGPCPTCFWKMLTSGLLLLFILTLESCFCGSVYYALATLPVQWQDVMLLLGLV